MLIKQSKFFKDEHLKPNTITAFFCMKVVAGIALTLIYTYYYTDKSKADIYRYFNDSTIISQLLFHHPAAWWSAMTGIQLENPEVFKHLIPTQYFSHPEADLATNNSLLIRIHSIMNYLSGYNIYINTLFFSFFSFVGCFLSYRFFTRFPVYEPVLIAIPFFLFPSILFWSSGALKESFLFFAVGLFLYPLRKPYGLKNFFLQLLAIAILLQTKSYVAFFLVLCTVMGITILLRVKTEKRIAAALLALLISGTAYWATQNNFCDILIQKRNEFSALAMAENAGSSIDTQILSGGCNSVLSQLPRSLIQSVFAPFIWSFKNIFELAFAIENTFLFVMLALSLTWKTKANSTQVVVATLCFLFALLNYLLIGLTVPVVGAIVHYRILATPFLLTGWIMLFNLNIPIYLIRLLKKY
ncbi:MAG: hypothetical protein IPN22_12325 [Bacteroidetes bacterium]|nr:hypothetical protein [Bacteroidota bacterium]